jgi:hypothetical protein
MHHSPILARCAYANQEVPLLAANFAFVSLYNDSSAAQVLAVREYAVEQRSDSTTGFKVAQGLLGSSPIQGKPVYTNAGSMPGVLSQGYVTVLPLMDLATAGGSTIAGWAHDFPMIVLAPGWAITAYQAAAGTSFFFGFWWEWMYPAQLLNPDIGPEHIGKY